MTIVYSFPFWLAKMSSHSRTGIERGESDSFVCLSVFAAEYPYMHWADRLPPDLGTAD